MCGLEVISGLMFGGVAPDLDLCSCHYFWRLSDVSNFNKVPFFHSEQVGTHQTFDFTLILWVNNYTSNVNYLNNNFALLLILYGLFLCSDVGQFCMFTGAYIDWDRLHSSKLVDLVCDIINIAIRVMIQYALQYNHWIASECDYIFIYKLFFS